MKKLQELLEDDYEDFELLDNVEKLSYVLGSELWESKFDGLLALQAKQSIELVKESIFCIYIAVWKYQKINYMIMAQDPVSNSILRFH